MDAVAACLEANMHAQQRSAVEMTCPYDDVKLEDDVFEWPRDGGYDYVLDYSDLSETASLASSGTHTREVSFEDAPDGDDAIGMMLAGFAPAPRFNEDEYVPSASLLDSYHPAQRDFSRYMMTDAAGHEWLRANYAMAEQLMPMPPAPAALELLPPIHSATVAPHATGAFLPLPSALKPIADTMAPAFKCELVTTIAPASPSPSPSPMPTCAPPATLSKAGHRVRQVGYKKPQNMRIQVNRLDISILLLRHQGDDGRHPNQQHVYYYQARIRNVYPQKHLWAGWETAEGVVDRVRAMAECFDDSFLDHAEAKKSASSTGASRRRKRES